MRVYVFYSYHPKRERIRELKERERQTDIQTERERQRDRQTDRQTDREGDFRVKLEEVSNKYMYLIVEHEKRTIGIVLFLKVPGNLSLNIVFIRAMADSACLDTLEILTIIKLKIPEKP